MSYSVTKIGGFGRPKSYREFLIDTTDDIALLPVTGIAPGSNAFCVENNSKYVFTNNKEWAIPGDDSGGGSGGGGGFYPVIITIEGQGKIIEANHTASEIIVAYQSGLMPYATMDDTAMTGTVDVVNWSFSSYRETSGGSLEAIFSVVNVTTTDTPQTLSLCCIIDDSGNVTPVQNNSSQ